jgi:hypothetical protein
MAICGSIRLIGGLAKVTRHRAGEGFASVKVDGCMR